MKFVEVFSIADLEELDVLWVKLSIQDEHVDKWIIVENQYTFQGKQKGYLFDHVLKSDPRFRPFADKILYIQCDRSLEGQHEGIFDDEARKVEEYQREQARAYILANYSDDDAVILSDLDEIIDFSDPERRSLVIRKLAATRDFIRVPHTRFILDFDNIWTEIRSIPVARVGFIRRTPDTLSHIRFFTAGTGPVSVWEREVAFEYSYCMSEAAILRKYMSFFHTGFTPEDVRRSIRCNCMAEAEGRGPKHKPSFNPQFWFRKTRLTARNSPRFVREHLDTLKTGTVPADYMRHRRLEYPGFFSGNPLSLKPLRHRLAAIDKRYDVTGFVGKVRRRIGRLIK